MDIVKTDENVLKMTTEQLFQDAKWNLVLEIIANNKKNKANKTPTKSTSSSSASSK